MNTVVCWCSPLPVLVPAPPQPYYIAPETMHHGHLNKSSDIYSLGVVMWEVHNAEPPWVSGTLPRTAQTYTLEIAGFVRVFTLPNAAPATIERCYVQIKRADGSYMANPNFPHHWRHRAPDLFANMVMRWVHRVVAGLVVGVWTRAEPCVTVLANAQPVRQPQLHQGHVGATARCLPVWPQRPTCKKPACTHTHTQTPD